MEGQTPLGSLLREGSLLTHTTAQGRFRCMAGSPNPSRRDLPAHALQGQRIQHRVLLVALRHSCTDGTELPLSSCPTLHKRLWIPLSLPTCS